MLKMIAWTYLSQERSVMLVPSCYLQPLSHDRPTRSNLATGLNRAVLCCTRSNGLWYKLPGCPVDRCRTCCQQSDTCWETSPSFSKAPLQHIGHGALLRCDAKRLHNWLDQKVGQQTLQTSIQLTKWSGVWYKNVSTDIIPDIDDLKQRLIGLSVICLVWTETERRWQGNRSVACKAKCLCSFQGKALRAPYYTNSEKLVETCFFVACWRLLEAKLYANLGLFT
jgi:hypothetical protein